MALLSGHVAVLGAGNMGSGIAQSLATAGYQTVVRDLTEKDLARGRETIEKNLSRSVERKRMTLEKRTGILSRLSFTTDLKTAVPGSGLVIEAVFEEEKVKRSLFSEIAPLVGKDTLVVTNTSSLSVGRLFDSFPNPERSAGLHFFFPASVNRLVEVIPGPSTSTKTLETLTALSFSMKKIPVRVRDAPGFCVNRFFVPFLNEATRIVEEGLGNPPAVDEAANELLGTKMGPFALMNATGIPIAFHSISSLGESLGPFYKPSSLLKSQFEKGEKWNLDAPARAENRDEVKGRLTGTLIGIAAKLVDEGVASAEDTERAAKVGLAWKEGPFSILNATGAIVVYEQVDKLRHRWGTGFPMAPRLGEYAIAGEKWPLSTVKVETDGPLGWILMDRPEAMNALNSTVLGDLGRAFSDLSKDPNVHVILLSSTSNVFAAGADIAEMVDKKVSEAMEFTTAGHALMRTLAGSEKPVIAVIDGYALGGGLELALSTDFILASESATLGLPEVSLGIIPGFGGTQRLPRIIGKARAKMLVLAGLQIKAQEAYDLGIVARLFPSQDLKEEARALAMTIASKAPVAVRLAKQAIDQGLEGSLETGLALERQLATFTFTTEDLREGMRAHLEKRPPQFKGA